MDNEIKQIIQNYYKSINNLKSIEEYFKEIENNFNDYIINNLNELLLVKILFQQYLKFKKENNEKSKKLLKNIKYLSSFNDLKLNKNEFNEFLKDKNNYILKGSGYKGDLNGEGQMNYFLGNYKGKYKNGIKEGKGKIKFKDGKKFICPFVNGKPNGIGIYENNKRKRKEVEFINGKINKDYKKIQNKEN